VDRTSKKIFTNKFVPESPEAYEHVKIHLPTISKNKENENGKKNKSIMVKSTFKLKPGSKKECKMKG